VVSDRDATRSDDPNIVALSGGLVGEYELSLQRGTYRITLNGRDAIPYTIPTRPGVEHGYLAYGWWVGAGVPPIGEGTDNGDAQFIAFHSTRGVCFDPGASPSTMNGLYRWTATGDTVTFQTATALDASSEASLGHFKTVVWAEGSSSRPIPGPEYRADRLPSAQEPHGQHELAGEGDGSHVRSSAGLDVHTREVRRRDVLGGLIHQYHGVAA
jgi:hypothetical protein